jgi:hypothetical protein
MSVLLVDNHNLSDKFGYVNRENAGKYERLGYFSGLVSEIARPPHPLSLTRCLMLSGVVSDGQAFEFNGTQIPNLGVDGVTQEKTNV